MTPAGQNQAEDYVVDLQDQTRWTPEQCELVAGAVRYTKYNWLIRFVMRRVSKAKGLATGTADHGGSRSPGRGGSPRWLKSRMKTKRA